MVPVCLEETCVSSAWSFRGLSIAFFQGGTGTIRLADTTLIEEDTQ